MISRFISLSLSFFISISPLLGQSLTAKRGWIKVHYQPDDTRNVESIFEVVTGSYPLIRDNLGIEFSGELNIYLAADGAEFGQLTGWRLKPWVQGVAMPGQNMVVLKSPRWSGSQIDLGRAAVHEFVHIVIAQDIGSIPRWLNEGLAVMLSGEIYFDPQALSAAALSGKFLSFREIERMMGYNSIEAALAYQQSLSATQYLVSEFGWGTVSRIFHGIKRGRNFNEAFEDATGLQVWEFEWEWEQTRGKAHRWTMLKDLDRYLGYLFGPLALTAGLFLYLRRRRVKKRWEEEERYYEEDDY